MFLSVLFYQRVLVSSQNLIFKTGRKEVSKQLLHFKTGFVLCVISAGLYLRCCLPDYLLLEYFFTFVAQPVRSGRGFIVSMCIPGKFKISLLHKIGKAFDVIKVKKKQVNTDCLSALQTTRLEIELIEVI